MTPITDEIKTRIGRIRLLALDSDGVLTDGGVYIDDTGREFRRFDIKDGLGIKLVINSGITVAVLSASTNEAIKYRAQKLGVHEVYTGLTNKLDALTSLCDKLDITSDQVAYMGDDLADIPILEHVGLPCAPADAVSEVLAIALITSDKFGGYGAVRQICNYLCDR